MNNNDRPITVNIPENFKNKSSFLGFEVQLLNVIEGIAFGIVGFAIDKFILIDQFGLSFSKNLTVMLVIILGFAIIGFVGIDDELIVTYIYNMIKFKKNRRVAYFNPRIKLEAKSIFDEDENREPLPKEKIIAIYDKYRKQIEEHNQEIAKIQEEEMNSVQELYFEDDIGVINKPEEYLTKKERKQIEKLNKKRMKEQKRKERQNAKKQKAESKKRK